MIVTNNLTGEDTEVDDIVEEPIVLTTEQQKQQIVDKLATLDNPRDAEDVYMSISTGLALSPETLARFNQKQALRDQLKGL